jgi:hypothetical protein
VKHKELAYRQNPEDSKRRNANLSRKGVSIEPVFSDLKRFRILQGVFPLRPEKFGLFVKPWPPQITTIYFIGNMSAWNYETGPAYERKRKLIFG